MVPAGEEPDLTQEPVGGHRHGELRVQHLERDLLARVLLLGKKDARSTTPRQFAVDGVAVLECVADRREEVAADRSPRDGDR
jgi:hypothetical protein